MTYDVYRYIFIAAAVLCGVMLAVSVLLFVLLKIPKAVGDLSGSTARKAIKNIRERNEATGDKAYKVSAVNEARGKITDRISLSGTAPAAQGQMRGINTSKIGTQNLTQTDAASETTVLACDGEAVAEQGFDGSSSGETTVLGSETDVLNFTVEYEITFIHTDEIISAETAV